MRAAIRLLFMVMLAGVCCGASAQIFECIDANGKLEFAQKCSPGTVRQREVAKTGTGEINSAAPPSTSYKEQEQAFRRRQSEREADERKERAELEAAKKKCATARTRLTSLENARRVKGANDPQTGEAHFLDENERAAATQKARDAVAENCR